MGSEEIEIVVRLTLGIALVAHAKTGHIGQCAKISLELGKAIDILIMESVNGIDIISVAVARVFELIVGTQGQREGLEPVLIDGFPDE